jgi:hypothetical protein
MEGGGRFSAHLVYFMASWCTYYVYDHFVYLLCGHLVYLPPFGMLYHHLTTLLCTGSDVQKEYYYMLALDSTI